MIAAEQITGLILAGGLGRRMSQDGRGTNKALRSFEGRPMIKHVIERLAPQVGSLVLNVNQDKQAFDAFDLPMVSDEISGFAGPLAGLHAGLQEAQTPWLLTCPCDSPFLPLDLVTRLADAADEGSHDLAVAYTGTQAHPVFALVNVKLLDGLTRFLKDGGRKIDAWYAPLSIARVDFEDESAFRNINTPQDLERYQRNQPGAMSDRVDPDKSS
ncbi:MAG: molybdenum cofactor guanylyltransferase MobA [Burkholderiaceae bacterium]